MGWESARVWVSQSRSAAGLTTVPMVFRIWMAPILEKMEEKMRGEAGVGAGVARANVGVGVELPSFFDDMCTDIVV